MSTEPEFFQTSSPDLGLSLVTIEDLTQAASSLSKEEWVDYNVHQHITRPDCYLVLKIRGGEICGAATVNKEKLHKAIESHSSI